MKSTSFVSVVALVLVSLALASFSSTAFALDENNSHITKTELRALLKTARTPAEHRRIAEYYRQEAQRLTAESKFHNEMGRIYHSRPLPYEAKHPYGAIGLSHCQYWSQLDLKQAKEAEALATLHEGMAKVAELK